METHLYDSHLPPLLARRLAHGPGAHKLALDDFGGALAAQQEHPAGVLHLDHRAPAETMHDGDLTTVYVRALTIIWNLDYRPPLVDGPPQPPASAGASPVPLHPNYRGNLRNHA